MPLRTWGGVSRSELQTKYGLSLFHFSLDNPADDEFNAVFSPWQTPLWSGVEANHQQYVPRALIIDVVAACISTPPGAGASRVFTLRVNGADSTLTANITGAASDRYYAVGTLGIATADAIAWRHNVVGVPAAITWASLLLLYHLV